MYIQQYTEGREGGREGERERESERENTDLGKVFAVCLGLAAGDNFLGTGGDGDAAGRN